MRIGLSSDFLDYYDHQFYRPDDRRIDTTLMRYAEHEVMPKWEQLKVLEGCGIPVPLHGAVFCTPAFFESAAPEQPSVVIYTDPYAHRGEGKELVSARDLMLSEDYQNLFATRYIDSRDAKTGYPMSRRILAVGNYLHLLKYTGVGGDWRSNYAPEVEIEWDQRPLAAWSFLTADYTKLTQQYPLWAIDLVQDPNSKKWYGIDFNTAPGLRGTGLEDKYPPLEIYSMFKEWFHDRF